MRLLLILVLAACSLGSDAGPATVPAEKSPESGNGSGFADVVSVAVRPDDGGYRFAVGLASPDTGCEQYADWWEVVSEDGELIYRRPLAHSHVDEQPFVRSGGPVAIDSDLPVWVRGHMHPNGYGGVTFFGSVAEGFIARESVHDFARGLADQPPTPPECRW